MVVPHAGGTSNAFAPLAERLEGLVTVRGVDLPGHGRRMREPLPGSIEAMAQDILASIRDVLDRPYALFGHSMGALAAHHLILLLREAGLPLPGRFFVSGCAAPGLSRLSPEVAYLPTEAFWRQVARYDGLPEGFLDYPELRDVFEPILRADFQAVATYRPPRAEAPAMPITVLCGREDAIAPQELAAWQTVTSLPLEMRFFPGGHFYLLEQVAQVAAFLGERCTEGLG